jgi:hypothetical protein
MLNSIRHLFEKESREEEAKTDRMRYKGTLPSTITEQEINRFLQRIVSKNRQKENILGVIRYISIELENDGIVKVIVMSNYYFRICIETSLIDLWCDHKSSSLTLKINEITLSKIPLLPRWVSEKLSYILLNTIGKIFNPIRLSDQSSLRFLDGMVSIESSHTPLEASLADTAKSGGSSVQDYFVIGAETSRGLLKPMTHALSPKGRARVKRGFRKCDTKVQREPFRFTAADACQLCVIAIVVFFCVMLLYPYLKIDFSERSFTWSFFSSLALLVMSFVVINTAREIYHYWLRLRNNYRKVEVKLEDNTYKLERLKREIDLEMTRIKEQDPLELERVILRASRCRARAKEIYEELENADFQRRIRYGLAYAVTILSEVVSYKVAPLVSGWLKISM